MRRRDYDDIFDVFDAMMRKMMRDFEEIYDSGEVKNERSLIYDITEDENNVYLSIELPGVDKENIDLRVDPTEVELKIENKKEETTNKEGFSSVRRSYYNIYRRIPLPCEVDPNKAKASYKNGVLEIVAPKVNEKGKRKLKID